jgi:hypothetical protein
MCCAARPQALMCVAAAIASHALTFEEAFSAADTEVLWLIVLAFLLAKVRADGWRIGGWMGQLVQVGGVMCGMVGFVCSVKVGLRKTPGRQRRRFDKMMGRCLSCYQIGQASIHHRMPSYVPDLQPRGRALRRAAWGSA